MIDFSKMTPELYKKIQSTRQRIDYVKKEIALLRLDDDYCEEDEDQIMRMENIIKEISKELEEYEI